MWKPVALSAALLLPGTAMAENIHLSTDDGDHCNAELQQTVRVGPNFLEIRKDSESAEPLVYFQHPAHLVINGKTVNLNEHQQQFMHEYQGQLHSTGRELLLISLEAVEVAFGSLSVALTALAGPDHPKHAELQQASEAFIRKVEERLNREGEIYTLGDPNADTLVDRTIEEEFKPEIAKLARESAGAIIWHALKAAFTLGRSSEDQVDETTEETKHKLKQRAKQLKQRVRQLCGGLQDIDKLEEELYQVVPQLSPYDIVTIKQN